MKEVLVSIENIILLREKCYELQKCLNRLYPCPPINLICSRIKSLCGGRNNLGLYGRSLIRFDSHFEYLAELIVCSEKDLKEIDQLGPTSIKKIKCWLECRGLHLEYDLSDYRIDKSNVKERVLELRDKYKL